MPTFPTWPGALPRSLQLLNWGHYGLLLYWLYFRPTALKCYLYQTAPELYRARCFGQLKRALAQPGYRNLNLVALG